MRSLVSATLHRSLCAPRPRSLFALRRPRPPPRHHSRHRPSPPAWKVWFFSGLIDSWQATGRERLIRIGAVTPGGLLLGSHRAWLTWDLLAPTKEAPSATTRHDGRCGQPRGRLGSLDIPWGGKHGTLSLVFQHHTAHSPLISTLTLHNSPISHTDSGRAPLPAPAHCATTHSTKSSIIHGHAEPPPEPSSS